MSMQLPEGKYKIISTLGPKVLSVNGETANDGTAVIQWQDQDKPNQRWQLTKIAEEGSDIFYTIGHPNSSMVMEAPGPWKRGNAIVMRRYEHDGSDQRHRQWKLESVPGEPDVCKIINRRRPFDGDDENFVIDVTDGDREGTNNIKLQPSWKKFPQDHPGDRQHWKLVRVSTPGPPPDPHPHPHPDPHDSDTRHLGER